MKLYLMPGACSLASHIALVWSGAAYELVPLTHTAVRADAYRRINPKAVVPALELDDGAILTESLAILEYLADQYPDSKLGGAPGDVLQHARLNEALAELVSDVHTTWSPLMVPDRYVTRAQNIDDARQEALVQLNIHYERLELRMRGKTWMLFDRRTVADAYLYVMCSWQARTKTPLSAYPSLDTFKSRLDQDPGIQRAIREEGIVRG